MAWPRALCAGTSNNPRTASSARLGRIQSPEILEHEPSLLRRKPGQLFPRGIAQPGTRAGRAGLEQRREVHAVAGGGATGALFVFVGLGPREGPAGVEQPAVQPLLTLDRLLVETARVQLARQLARLLRQRSRRRAPALDLRRDERVLPRRLADLPLHRRRPLLDRRLARPRRGTALSAAQRFGHLLLAVGERRRLRQRAVERAERLLAPRAGERVAPRPQRLGEPRQLLLRGLPGPLGAGLVGLPGGLGGPLHRGLRLPRGLLRRRERRLPPGRRPEVSPHLLDAV